MGHFTTRKRWMREVINKLTCSLSVMISSLSMCPNIKSYHNNMRYQSHTMELKETEGKEGRGKGENEREKVSGRENRKKKSRNEVGREEIRIIIIEHKGLRRTLTHSIKVSIRLERNCGMCTWWIWPLILPLRSSLEKIPPQTSGNFK